MHDFIKKSNRKAKSKPSTAKQQTKTTPSTTAFSTVETRPEPSDRVSPVDCTRSRARTKWDPGEGGKKAQLGTKLEVRGYLLLIELQPGGIEREPQSSAGVHQTPPVLGERHRERETLH